MFAGKHVLITGGTGSYGRRLLDRLLGLDEPPETITVFSRDEEKQHRLRYHYPNERLRLRIGDVRDSDALHCALCGKNIVFNAAALKQVPACEYAPREAILTNVIGADNLIGVIERFELPVETVVGISTDKACKPVNVMGMTKAIQERVFIQANLRAPQTRFVCVRYGNVLASRGSVIPLFLRQAKAGKPLTVTDPEMTRFLLSLDEAVDTSLQALRAGRAGEVVVPRAPSATVGDIAAVIAKDGGVDVQVIGVRPGEKHHEIMVSEEEVPRARANDRWFHIQPMLADLQTDLPDPTARDLTVEYSSALDPLPRDELEALLRSAQLLPTSGNEHA